MIREAIARLIERQDLAMDEAEGVMQEIMNGDATPSQIAAFVTALRMKGEKAQEIAGCARVMRANAIKVTTRRSPVVDTCGTGGDGTGTFNVSTIVAFVAAGAGLAVAKHGNRSVSSRCGSADVLEALGAVIDLTPDQIGECLDTIGIGFLYAPSLHPAMRHAAGPRREMGVRTVFNVLGPLTNPASASIQLVGTYHPDLTETLAEVLRLLGTERALVVHGVDGMDELSVTGPSKVTQLRDGTLHTYQVCPDDFGLPVWDGSLLAGGAPEENAAITRAVLDGEKGPRRDTVLLNAAAILFAAGTASDMLEGLTLAAESLDSGRALGKLDEFIHMTQTLRTRDGS